MARDHLVGSLVSVSWSRLRAFGAWPWRRFSAFTGSGSASRACGESLDAQLADGNLEDVRAVVAAPSAEVDRLVQTYGVRVVKRLDIGRGPRGQRSDLSRSGERRRSWVRLRLTSSS